MPSAFDKEGHRGCRGLMPENTVPAMLKGIDAGVTTLEMDVHITKDSGVVLSHDAWLNPDITTKPDGSYINSPEAKYVLYNMTYDGLQQFDVGSKPYGAFPQQQKLKASLPLLSTVIDSVEAYCARHLRRVDYNIEIKSSPKGDGIYHPEPAVFTELVMKLLVQKKVLPYVIIQSFDNRPLQYLHQQYPDIRTSLLIEDYDKRSLQQQFSDLGFVPAVYSPHHSLATKQRVDSCHAQHCKVIPWTINDLPTMQRLKNLGVDGLISDYPNLYKDLR